MPRAPRADIGGLVFHVLNRANARVPLFDDDVDYRRFAQLLAEERTRIGMRLLAWCLMPNHWHLVLWPRDDGDLGRFVRRLTQRHTQARHARLGTRGQGHVYQGRYKAFLVQDDAHLLAVCRYVDRNPLRAGLVGSAGDWPHGSLAELRRRGPARLLDPWPLPRPPRWTVAVDRAETPRELEALRRSAQRGTPYGSGGWTAAMADRFDLRSTLRPPGRPPRKDDAASTEKAGVVESILGGMSPGPVLVAGPVLRGSQSGHCSGGIGMQYRPGARALGSSADPVSGRLVWSRGAKLPHSRRPPARAPRRSPPRAGTRRSGCRDWASSRPGGRVHNAHFDALREGLGQAGQVEGRTFLLEARFSEGENDRLPALAAELIALPVDLICCVGAVTVRAIRRASTTAPLLFTIVLDPVADGLVPSMERPGGATSGVTNFDPAQALAQIRLLKRVVPGLERLAILGDPGVPDLFNRANVAACEAEGIRPQVLLLRGAAEDLDAVFAAIVAERAQAVLGLYVPTVVFLHARRLVEMATAARLPTMLPADWEAHGPLLTFGASLSDGVRLMAGQADRVFRGARPGDLSVEVVTRHRLTVNRRVALEIGVTIPPDLLARAGQKIE